MVVGGVVLFISVGLNEHPVTLLHLRQERVLQLLSACNMY